MKIQKLSYDKKNATMSFMIEDTTPDFANMLRRAITDRVPTLAIEEVEIKDNDSILYDEMLAHRLGMLPLKTDLKTYSLRDECKCKGEGCARCTVELSLKQKGPKVVYASDIKSKDPKVKPAFPETPIVKLLKDQKVELVGKAILGTGKEHIKWSPGMAYYIYKPEVKVNNKSKLFEKFKGKYPPQAFTKGKLDKKKILDLDLADACSGICEEIIDVDWDENSIIFNIESWGQLSPKDIVNKACEILDSQFDELKDSLKK